MRTLFTFSNIKEEGSLLGSDAVYIKVFHVYEHLEILTDRFLPKLNLLFLGGTSNSSRLTRESLVCKGIWHIDEALNNKQDSSGM